VYRSHLKRHEQKWMMHASKHDFHKDDASKQQQTSNYVSGPKEINRKQFLKVAAASGFISAVVLGGGFQGLAANAIPEKVRAYPDWKPLEDFSKVKAAQCPCTPTYSAEFISYLARFLVQYDGSCASWWMQQIDDLPRSLKQAQLEHILREDLLAFATSIGYGLPPYDGDEGAAKLGNILVQRYGRSSQAAALHLASLLALIKPPFQPVEAIAEAIRLAQGGEDIQGGFGGREKEVESSPFPGVLLPPPPPLPARQLDTSKTGEEGKEQVYYFYSLAESRLPEVFPLAAGHKPVTRERGLGVVDFEKFAVAGALGCAFMHTVVVPLDVVKTRLQTSPGRYTGLVDGVQTIIKEEGPIMLMQGSSPTIAGFAWYGLTVYPGYEFFKRAFFLLVGPTLAVDLRTPLVLAAGATATFFACLGVCPAEAVRIRMVADPEFAPKGGAQALGRIVSEEGIGRLYDGFNPILVRQVIFGMVKFLVFDYFAEFAYNVYPALKAEDATQLLVSLVSGLVAGVASCIVSQPADTIVSRMNRGATTADTAIIAGDGTPEAGNDETTLLGAVQGILQESGPQGFYAGLGGRVIWAGAIISGQFLLYDILKKTFHVAETDIKVFWDVITQLSMTGLGP